MVLGTRSKNSNTSFSPSLQKKTRQKEIVETTLNPLILDENTEMFQYSSQDGAVGGISYLKINEKPPAKNITKKENIKKVIKKNNQNKNSQKNPSSSNGNMDRSYDEFIELSVTDTSQVETTELQFDFDKLPNPQLKDVIHAIKMVHTSISFLAEKYDLMLKENERLTQENKKLKISQVKNRDDILVLQQEVNAMKYEMNANLQQKLNANILINGLPNYETEHDCKKTIVEMVSKIGVDFEMGKIKSIRKITNKKTKMFEYICEVESKELKNEIINGRKNKEIALQENQSIVVRNHFNKNTVQSKKENTQMIFINEHLTKLNHELLLKAKKLKHCGYKYVWYKFGKILVKKCDDSSAILINSDKIISDLLLKETLIHNNI